MVLAQEDLLTPLSNHAQGGLEHTVKRLQRHRGAGQVKPRERLGGPIFVDGARDPLNQFLTMGMYPLCLAFGARSPLVCPLMSQHIQGHYIHGCLFAGCSVAQRADLQNHPIIVNNHSTSVCPS